VSMSILTTLGSAMIQQVAASTPFEQKFLDLSTLVPLIKSSPTVGGPASAQQQGPVLESLPVGEGGQAADGLPPGGLPPAGGTPPPPSQNIDLLDMTLPADLLNLVTPVLSKLRMRIEPRELSNRFTKNARMHFARNGSFSTYVLHFQWQILSNAQWASVIMGYGYLFRAGDHVRIVSKDCGDPEESYEFAWQTWADTGVDVKYVEWRYMAKLARADEARRPDLLKLAFGLPEPKVATAADLATDTTRLGKLAGVLAKTGAASTQSVSDWINARLYGLPDGMRLERSDWGKAFPPAARDFVAWLVTKGEHPGREGFTCLAVVLIDLAPELGGPDRDLVIELLETYRLVSPDDVLRAAITQVRDA
jgi:hypothetical protein